MAIQTMTIYRVPRSPACLVTLTRFARARVHTYLHACPPARPPARIAARLLACLLAGMVARHGRSRVVKEADSRCLAQHWPD